MKFILAAAAVAALKLSRGICDGELMYTQGPHWKKAWPQGDTDSGENDEDVVEREFDGRPQKRAPAPAVYTAPTFEVDEDVIQTMDSLDQSGGDLAPHVAADRGMGIVAADFADPIGHIPKQRWNADGKLTQVDENDSPAGI